MSDPFDFSPPSKSKANDNKKDDDFFDSLLGGPPKNRNQNQAAILTGPAAAKTNTTVDNLFDFLDSPTTNSTTNGISQNTASTSAAPTAASIRAKTDDDFDDLFKISTTKKKSGNTDNISVNKFQPQAVPQQPGNQTPKNDIFDAFDNLNGASTTQTQNGTGMTQQQSWNQQSQNLNVTSTSSSKGTPRGNLDDLNDLNDIGISMTNNQVTQQQPAQNDNQNFNQTQTVDRKSDPFSGLNLVQDQQNQAQQLQAGQQGALIAPTPSNLQSPDKAIDDLFSSIVQQQNNFITVGGQGEASSGEGSGLDFGGTDTRPAQEGVQRMSQSVPHIPPESDSQQQVEVPSFLNNLESRSTEIGNIGLNGGQSQQQLQFQQSTTRRGFGPASPGQQKVARFDINDNQEQTKTKSTQQSQQSQSQSQRTGSKDFFDSVNSNTIIPTPKSNQILSNEQSQKESYWRRDTSQQLDDNILANHNDNDEDLFKSEPLEQFVDTQKISSTTVTVTSPGKSQTSQQSQYNKNLNKSKKSSKRQLQVHDSDDNLSSQFVYEKSFWSNPEEWSFFHENSYTNTQLAQQQTSTINPLKSKKKLSKKSRQQQSGQCQQANTSNTNSINNPHYDLDNTIDSIVPSSRAVLSSSKELTKHETIQLSRTGNAGSFVCCCANQARNLLCLGTARGPLVLHDAKLGASIQQQQQQTDGGSGNTNQNVGGVKEGVTIVLRPDENIMNAGPGRNQFTGGLGTMIGGSGGNNQEQQSQQQGGSSGGNSQSLLQQGQNYGSQQHQQGIMSQQLNNNMIDQYQNQSFSDHLPPASSMAFSEDGSSLVVGHDRLGWISIWSIDRRRLLHVVKDLPETNGTRMAYQNWQRTQQTNNIQQQDQSQQQNFQSNKTQPPPSDHNFARAIISIAFKPGGSNTDVLASDSLGTVFLIVFRPIFQSIHCEFALLRDSMPEVGVCLKCLPYPTSQRTSGMLGSSGSQGKKLQQQKSQQQNLQKMKTNDQLGNSTTNNDLDDLDVDNSSLILLISSHGVVLIEMSPSIHLLQKISLYEPPWSISLSSKQYQQQTNLSNQSQSQSNNSQSVPDDLYVFPTCLPDACWIRVPGASSTSASQFTTKAMTAGTLGSVSDAEGGSLARELIKIRRNSTMPMSLTNSNTGIGGGHGGGGCTGGNRGSSILNLSSEPGPLGGCLVLCYGKNLHLYLVEWQEKLVPVKESNQQQQNNSNQQGQAYNTNSQQGNTITNQNNSQQQGQNQQTQQAQQGSNSDGTNNVNNPPKMIRKGMWQLVLIRKVSYISNPESPINIHTIQALSTSTFCILDSQLNWHTFSLRSWTKEKKQGWTLFEDDDETLKKSGKKSRQKDRQSFNSSISSKSHSGKKSQVQIKNSKKSSKKSQAMTMSGGPGTLAIGDGSSMNDETRSVGSNRSHDVNMVDDISNEDSNELSGPDDIDQTSFLDGNTMPGFSESAIDNNNVDYSDSEYLGGTIPFDQLFISLHKESLQGMNLSYHTRTCIPVHLLKSHLAAQQQQQSQQQQSQQQQQQQAQNQQNQSVPNTPHNMTNSDMGDDSSLSPVSNAVIGVNTTESNSNNYQNRNDSNSNSANSSSSFPLSFHQSVVAFPSLTSRPSHDTMIQTSMNTGGYNGPGPINSSIDVFTGQIPGMMSSAYGYDHTRAGNLSGITHLNPMSAMIQVLDEEDEYSVIDMSESAYLQNPSQEGPSQRQQNSQSVSEQNNRVSRESEQSKGSQSQQTNQGKNQAVRAQMDEGNASNINPDEGELQYHGGKNGQKNGIMNKQQQMGKQGKNQQQQMMMNAKNGKNLGKDGKQISIMQQQLKGSKRNSKGGPGRNRSSDSSGNPNQRASQQQDESDDQQQSGFLIGMTSNLFRKAADMGRLGIEKSAQLGHASIQKTIDITQASVDKTLQVSSNLVGHVGTLAHELVMEDSDYVGYSGEDGEKAMMTREMVLGTSDGGGNIEYNEGEEEGDNHDYDNLNGQGNQEGGQNSQQGNIRRPGFKGTNRQFRGKGGTAKNHLQPNQMMPHIPHDPNSSNSTTQSQTLSNTNIIPTALINRPMFICCSTGYIKLEIMRWLAILDLLVSQEMWDLALRVLLDVHEGQLPPLLDFPVEEQLRKPVLKKKIVAFLKRYLDYRLSQEISLLMQTAYEKGQGSLKGQQIFKLSRSFGNVIELCIAVCLKCGLYNFLFKFFFERLNVKVTNKNGVRQKIAMMKSRRGNMGISPNIDDGAEEPQGSENNDVNGNFDTVTEQQNPNQIGKTTNSISRSSKTQSKNSTLIDDPSDPNSPNYDPDNDPDHTFQTQVFRAYYLECLEQQLLQHNIVQELDAEVYRYILQSYRIRLKIEEELALSQIKQLLNEVVSKKFGLISSNEALGLFIGVGDLKEMATVEDVRRVQEKLEQEQLQLENIQQLQQGQSENNVDQNVNGNAIDPQSRTTQFENQISALTSATSATSTSTSETQHLSLISSESKTLKKLTDIPFHLQHDPYLNISISPTNPEILGTLNDFFPAAYSSALHLTRLIISRNDVFHLDLDLCIRIFSEFRMFTALIYVYVGVKDFISPLELLVGECTKMAKSLFHVDYNVLEDGMIEKKMKSLQEYHQQSIQHRQQVIRQQKMREVQQNQQQEGLSQQYQQKFQNQQQTEDNFRSVYFLVDEPCLSQFLLLRKLFHFLDSTCAGKMFLATLPPPEVSETIPELLKVIYKRPRLSMNQQTGQISMSQQSTGNQNSTDIPPPVMFARLLKLSPLMLFRSLSQLYTSKSGLFYTTDTSNHNINYGPSTSSTGNNRRRQTTNNKDGTNPDLISPLGFFQETDLAFHQTLNDTVSGTLNPFSSDVTGPMVASIQHQQNKSVPQQLPDFAMYQAKRRRRHALAAYHYFQSKVLTSSVTSLTDRVPLSRYWQVVEALLEDVDDKSQTNLQMSNLDRRYFGKFDLDLNIGDDSTETQIINRIPLGNDAEELGIALCKRIQQKQETESESQSVDLDATEQEQRQTVTKKSNLNVDLDKMIQRTESVKFWKMQSHLHELRGDYRAAIVSRLRLLTENNSTTNMNLQSQLKSSRASSQSLQSGHQNLLNTPDQQRRTTTRATVVSPGQIHGTHSLSVASQVYEYLEFSILPKISLEELSPFFPQLLQELGVDRTCLLCLASGSRFGYERVAKCLSQDELNLPRLQIAYLGKIFNDFPTSGGMSQQNRKAARFKEDQQESLNDTINSNQTMNMTNMSNLLDPVSPNNQLQMSQSQFYSPARAQALDRQTNLDHLKQPDIKFMDSFLPVFVRLLCESESDPEFNEQNLVPSSSNMENESLVPFLQRHEGLLPLEETLKTCLELNNKEGSKFLLEKVGDFVTANKIFCEQFEEQIREQIGKVNEKKALGIARRGEGEEGVRKAILRLDELIRGAHDYSKRIKDRVAPQLIESLWTKFFTFITEARQTAPPFNPSLDISLDLDRELSILQTRIVRQGFLAFIEPAQVLRKMEQIIASNSSRNLSSSNMNSGNSGIIRGQSSSYTNNMNSNMNMPATTTSKVKFKHLKLPLLHTLSALQSEQEILQSAVNLAGTDILQNFTEYYVKHRTGIMSNNFGILPLHSGSLMQGDMIIEGNKVKITVRGQT